VFFGINMKRPRATTFIDRWSSGHAGLAAAIAEELPEIALRGAERPDRHGEVPRPSWTIDRVASQAVTKRLVESWYGPDNGRFPRTIANRLWQR
jgi:hypothetical protein